MTTMSKFKGKIRDNPLVALEKGNRDVMLTIWREYLQELLELDPKSGRRQLLINRIEQAAKFDALFGDWNNLPSPERAERWLTLIRTAKSELEEVRTTCLRCGECCEKSSPTLMAADMHLFQDNILHWTEVYTLRRGEKALSPRTGETAPTTAERLKIKEHSGAKYCLFYAANPNRCLIYEQRPQQCREQLCNLSEADRPAAAASDFLDREAIFGQHPELWALINAHEERCAVERLETALAEVSGVDTPASDALFDMLHFDHYLRQMLIQEWEIPPGALDFLLGRPLTQILRQFGLKAEMSPEGVFHLERLSP